MENRGWWRRWVWRSLCHYRRTNVGVVAAAAVTAAVVVGALAVGDAVRASLRERALSRIGAVDAALQLEERFFADDLGERVVADLVTRGIADAAVACTLRLDGVANVQGRRGSGAWVRVHGVDADFFALGPDGAPGVRVSPGEIALSAGLRAQLQVEPGARLLLRVTRPSALPRDLALARIEDVALALPVTVADRTVDDRAFGAFALRADPDAAANGFVDRNWLQQQLEIEGRANTLLLASRADRGGGAAFAEAASAAVRRVWRLDDLQLELGTVVAGAETIAELRSQRVFLDPAVVEVLRAGLPDAVGLLTWFVNGIGRAGGSTIPYSTVTGWGPLGEGRVGDGPYARAVARTTSSLEARADPADPRPMALTDWAASDLGVAVGDTVDVDYYVMGPQLRLEERRGTFSVAAVVPLDGIVDDATLMPPFPGLSESENCRDWEPGIPVELDRIRDRDEAYWDAHKGAPKALVRFEDAVALWANPYGQATAVRVPRARADALRELLRENVDPAGIGLFFADVRAPALATAAAATDFGGLFVGLSFFLVVAALLLTAMLFAFGVEQRARSIGTLLAVGYRPRQVRRLVLAEGFVLATAGAVLGVALGAGYTWAVLEALQSIWSGAVGGARIGFRFSPSWALAGAAIAVICCLLAMMLGLRRLFRRPAVELLAGAVGVTAPAAARSGRGAGVLAVTAAVAAVALAAMGVLGAVGGGGSGAAQALVFFGAGSSVLVAGVAGLALVLRRPRRGAGAVRSVRALAGTQLRRRPGRSLTATALLASGGFLVLAVQAHRLVGPADPTDPAAGTGGFAAFGRTVLPLLRSLATEEGRAAYGLDVDALEGVDLWPVRVREGDDASCLNLAQPRVPTLLGVPSAALAARGAFSFVDAMPPPEAPDRSANGSPWEWLQADYGPGVVPAIGDAASVAWSMHKALGEGFEFVDESGQPFEVRIVGLARDSVLQGRLVVDEDRFRERFPSVAGYRQLWIDVPMERRDAALSALGRSLRDLGFEGVPAEQRLARYFEVQNTYLLIFQALGALGLLLGTVGLGVVVLRNTLERRGELALVAAVGWRRADLRRWLFWEHAQLLAQGVGLGAIAAAVGLAPTLLGRGVGWGWFALVLLALLACGAFWVGLACAAAVRSARVAALQEGL